MVDNRSTDGTAALVARRTRRATRACGWWPRRSGAGPSYARNVGFEAAAAELIAACDADDVVAAGLGAGDGRRAAASIRA